MGTRQVLLLNASGLTAYCCRNGKVVAEAEFQAASDDFDSYLKRHCDDVHVLLVDVAEESFELECLPHVRGHARDALIARKRERHSHGSPLCVALAQGRQSEGRRNDRFLFAALTQTRLVEPWLRSLEQAEATLGGIYSLPQLVAGIAAPSAGESFVLTTVGHGGLRQTFIAEGHLRFSRLTPLPGDAIEDAAAACADEAANMRRYLCAQRLAERDAPLPVAVLAHATQFDGFRRHCRDSDELRFHYLDLGAEAVHRGLATPLDDSRSDELFAHMLARKPPRAQFAPATTHRNWQLRRMRRALDAIGLTALAASLLFAAVQLPGVLRMREAAAQLQAQNESEESLLRATQVPSSLALPAQDLRELAVAAEALERVSPGPAPMLHRLSRAMDDLAAIDLESLEWQVTAEFQQVQGPFAVLDVRGTLSLGGDPSHRSVDRLAERLRADASIRTLVVKSPFAEDSSQTLKSADASADDGSFILRIAQRL